MHPGQSVQVVCFRVDITWWFAQGNPSLCPMSQCTLNSTPFILKSVPVWMTNYVVVFSIILAYRIFLLFLKNFFQYSHPILHASAKLIFLKQPFTTLLSCFIVASRVRSQCLGGLLSSQLSHYSNIYWVPTVCTILCLLQVCASHPAIPLRRAHGSLHFSCFFQFYSTFKAELRWHFTLCCPCSLCLPSL